MPPALVPVSVADVRLAVPAGAGVEAGMLVLREDRPPWRALRIVIARPEARAISAAWKGPSSAAAPGRPSTWDLFISALVLLHGRLSRAVITAVQERRHFFASIELEREGKPVVLACRPSDAVALALRTPGAEIYADEEVLAAAGVPEDGAWHEAEPGAEPGTGEAAGGSGSSL